VYDVLLALHLLFAVFAIGPLVHAATTAARGIRHNDAAATASGARTCRIYAFASLLVIALGFALMSQKSPYAPGRHVGEFGQTWIWLSLVLWVLAMALVLGLVAPSLDRATRLIAEQQTAAALTARVGAGGGVVGLIFAAIVFLMVYQPGR
jgi:uncharacterized membrane protein